MGRGTLRWICASLPRALALTAALAVIPLGQVASAALVVLMFLQRGPRSAAMAAAGAAALLLAADMAFGQLPLPLLLLPVATWLAAWLLAWLLRSGWSLARVVQAATLMGVAGALGYLALAGTPLAIWRGALDATLVPWLQAHGGSMSDAHLDRMAELLTGMLAMLWVLMLALAVLLGRWLDARLRQAPGRGGQFAAYRNGWAVTLLVSAVYVLTLLSDSVWAANVALVLLVGLILQGLAVAHGIRRARGLGGIWLACLYGLLAAAPLVTSSALSTVGFMDEWVNFRARLGRAG